MVSALAQRYDCRKITIIGSILAAIGFIISYFTNNIISLYFTYGILSGKSPLTSDPFINSTPTTQESGTDLSFCPQSSPLAIISRNAELLQLESLSVAQVGGEFPQLYH